MLEFEKILIKLSELMQTLTAAVFVQIRVDVGEWRVLISLFLMNVKSIRFFNRLKKVSVKDIEMVNVFKTETNSVVCN